MTISFALKINRMLSKKKRTIRTRKKRRMTTKKLCSKSTFKCSK